MSLRYSYVIIGVVGLAIAAGLTMGSFGIVAGQPHISVPIESHNSTTVTLLNTGSGPISFTVVLPTFKSTDNNTVPNVTVSPMSATIPPKTNVKVNVTAYVSSKNNKVNDSWVGVMQFVEVSNVTNPGGAVVNAGLAKILTVTAAPPLASPIPYLIIGVIALVVVISAVTVLYINKSKSRKPAKAVRTVAAKKVARAKAAGIVAKTAKKPPARKAAKSHRKAPTKRAARKKTVAAHARRRPAGTQRKAIRARTRRTRAR